jgi:hypothetical protein
MGHTACLSVSQPRLASTERTRTCGTDTPARESFLIFGDGLVNKALGLGTLFEDFLKTSRKVLHSLTHSGTAQLQKRWDADWLGCGFDDEDISALLATCSVAVFLITILITKHYRLEEQTKAAEAAWLELGQAAKPS